MHNFVHSLLGVVFFVCFAPSAAGQNQTWIRQFGTSSSDLSTAGAPDALGGVYVCGETDGSLGGSSAGQADVWIARYDAAGQQTWIRQLGTSSSDSMAAAAADGSGGAYVTRGDRRHPGWTEWRKQRRLDRALRQHRNADLDPATRDQRLRFPGSGRAGRDGRLARGRRWLRESRGADCRRRG